MHRKTSSTFFVSILLLSILFGTRLTYHAKAQAIPTVAIAFANWTNSSAYEYKPGNTFRVNVIVDSPDIGVWSWQVGIHFNNTILECTSLGNGTFFAGKYTSGFQPGTIHNYLGYVTSSEDSLTPPETTGVKGSGVLMWFEFRVRVSMYVSCLLDLTLSPPDLTCGTELDEIIDGDIVPISPITLYDGLIKITRIGDLGGGVPPQFFKCDGKVDGKDMALFLQCYRGLAPPEAMYLGDLGGGTPQEFFNYDGKVDGIDFAMFIQCYNGLAPDYYPLLSDFFRDGGYHSFWMANTSTRLSARFTSPETCEVNRITCDICYGKWPDPSDVCRVGIQADYDGKPSGSFLGYFDWNGDYVVDLDHYSFNQNVTLTQGVVYHLVFQAQSGEPHVALTYYEPGHHRHAKSNWYDPHLAVLRSFDNGDTWKVYDYDPAISVVKVDGSNAFPLPYIDIDLRSIRQYPANIYVGQIIRPSAAFFVSGVKFCVDKIGYCPTPLYVDLYDATHDVVLESKNFNPTDLPPPNEEGFLKTPNSTLWTFSKVYSLFSGIEYRLRFRTDSGDLNNCYRLWYLYQYTDIGKHGSWAGDRTCFLDGSVERPSQDLIYAFF